MPKRLRLFSVLLSAAVLCAAVPLSVRLWKMSAERAFTWEDCGGAVCITAYSGMQAEWIIPETLGGLPVVKIADRAFSGNEAVHTLRLPAALREIGAYAFYACPNLCDVQTQSSLQTVGDYAFSQCPLLTQAEMDAETIGEGAFSGITALQSVTLYHTQRIGEAAFADCPALQTVTLPPTLQAVGKEAFYNDPMLQTVTVPKQTKLGKHAFGYRCGSHIVDSMPVEGFVLHRE